MAVGRLLTATRRAIPPHRPTVADWLADAVPEWLAAAARPQPAPVPWPDMIRAVLAICLPIGTGIAIGQQEPGLLVALGGLLGVMVDNGGPIDARLRRVGSATAGGALGLVLGSLLHGHGWMAVIALVAIAGVSAPLSAIGGNGSVAGLELAVPRLTQLMALLNQANLIGEAGTALSIEGTRPPREVSDTLGALADTIRSGAPPRRMPRLTASTPGMRALRDELEGVARVLSGKLVYRGELIEPRPGCASGSAESPTG